VDLARGDFFPRAGLALNQHVAAAAGHHRDCGLYASHRGGEQWGRRHAGLIGEEVETEGIVRLSDDVGCAGFDPGDGGFDARGGIVDPERSGARDEFQKVRGAVGVGLAANLGDDGRRVDRECAGRLDGGQYRPSGGLSGGTIQRRRNPENSHLHDRCLSSFFCRSLGKYAPIPKINFLPTL
jgi:hypothetical protein